MSNDDKKFEGMPLFLHAQYKDETHEMDFKVDTDNKTMWFTVKELASLFDCSEDNIRLHIKNIFNDNELKEESVSEDFSVTASDGKNYKIKHYNLEVAIAVGYRVNSKQATKFRQWSNNIINQYITQGYVLNERRLTEDKTALLKLARDVRRLRSKSENIYQSVRDVFKICCDDYKEDVKETDIFFAELQNNFYYAVCGTVRDGLLQRADSSQFRMNAIACLNKYIDKKSATTGANYLTGDELYLYHIVFAETKMIKGEKMKMQELMNQFKKILEIQGHEILTDEKMKIFYKKIGLQHAEKEFELYKKNRKKEDDKTMKNEDIDIIVNSLKELEQDMDLSNPVIQIIENVKKKVEEYDNIKMQELTQKIPQNLEFKNNNNFEPILNKIANTKKPE